jgi:hypothetical protein
LFFDDFPGTQWNDGFSKAYMVVSGVPERITNHAIETIEMGTDMIAEISTLRNPINGKPVMIRVGNEKTEAITFCRTSSLMWLILRLPYWLGGCWCCGFEDAPLLLVRRCGQYSWSNGID